MVELVLVVGCTISAAAGAGAGAGASLGSKGQMLVLRMGLR